MDYLSNWFKGFEKGIARLSQEQREGFFSECGKNCVENGVLPVYKELYESAAGDLDTFFQKANKLPGVRAEVVEAGCIYHLYFLECTCRLCKDGYVATPLLCECSRQSVLYTMHLLWSEKKFNVLLCHSILQGEEECKLRVKVLTE